MNNQKLKSNRRIAIALIIFSTLLISGSCRVNLGSGAVVNSGDPNALQQSLYWGGNPDGQPTTGSGDIPRPVGPTNTSAGFSDLRNTTGNILPSVVGYTVQPSTTFIAIAGNYVEIDIVKTGIPNFKIGRCQVEGANTYAQWTYATSKSGFTLKFKISAETTSGTVTWLIGAVGDDNSLSNVISVVVQIVGKGEPTPTTITVTTTTAQPAGSTWSSATVAGAFTGRRDHTSASINNLLFIFSGFTGAELGCDIWYSSDGASWSTIPSSFGNSAYSSAALVNYNGLYWLLSGAGSSFDRNDIWYTADGLNWSSAVTASYSNRQSASAVTFANKVYLMGGDSATMKVNDVYSSNNLTMPAWNAHAQAPWSGRKSFTASVFQNKVWVIGGYTGTFELNDIWYTADFATWTQAPSAPFSPRNKHSVIQFGPNLYLMGGSSGGSPFNDVWFTSDGLNWTQAVANAPWSFRDSFSLVIHKQKIWLIGGLSAGPSKNDVWVTP